MTVLIQVPGVVRTDTGDPVQGVILPVISMLASVRVVFCSTDERDEKFLQREGMKGHAGFRNTDLLTALAEERTLGNVDLVMTPDTDEAREVAKQGVSVMLCAASRAVNPRWRPERKSWGQIMEEADA